jgi:hypothetical protein
LTDKFIENQVLPILVSVSFDRGEFPSARMAAISQLLFTTDADVNIWQQLAYSTWFAASQEVHSFIYTSFQNLAQLKGPFSSHLWSMVQKARTVLSLAKPIAPGYAKSRNSFASTFAEHLQSGYSHQFQYFGAKDSNAPQYLQYHTFVQQGNGGNKYSPFEISAHGHTVQKLVDYFIQEAQEQKPHLQEGHPDYLAIRQILGIEKREQEEEMEGHIQFQIQNQMQRIFSVNEQKIQQLMKQARTKWLPQLRNGYRFNYQKTFQIAESNVEVPSGMGIPLSFSHRVTVHLSLRGNVKLVQEGKDAQAVAEVHAVYGKKSHTRAAFKAPFAGKQYQSGIQRHVVLEAPLRAAVRYAPQGQVVVAFTPAQLEKGNPSGEIDIATYHQHPYTIIITDALWPVSHKEGGKMQVVRSHPSATQQTPYKNSQSAGENYFGLAFRLDEESDYQQESERISQWAKLWKSFHSPSCFFNLGWFGNQQMRFAERKITLDVAKSQTRTLAFIFAGKNHRNAQYQSLWKDSSSQSSQSSEESASSESSQDSSSQQQSNESRFNRQQQSRAQKQQDSDSSSAQASSEDQAQYGAVYAVGLIGKRVALRSAQDFKSIQKILDQSSPSTVQYLLQFSQSNGRVYIRGASGDAANEAAAALPRSSSSLQELSQAVHDAQNAQAQPEGCFEFEGEYDAPQAYQREQLLVLRKKLLADELVVNVKGELQFGKSCKGMPHQIKAVGKLQRGQQQTEYAQSKSRQAQKCQQDEQKGFSVSPVCIEVAQQQAAALNRGQFKIQYSEMPEEVRNASYNAEDLVKTLFYPYMSHDRTHQGAGEGQAQVSYRMTPDKQFFNVEIIKPNSRLTFQDIKTNNFFQAAMPPTATQSFHQNMADRLFRSDSQPSCTLEGNYVNTFDNVTYRFSSQAVEGCQHVLAQDCSEEYPVAVLVKDIAADQNEVTILLGQKTKIQLTPQAKQSRLDKSKVQVRINGQRVESLPSSIRDQQSKQAIVYVEQMHDGGVQVFSEHFDVATNGQYVAVYASNYLRNKTCGLCGDFNGEKVAEMKSPKNCPMSSGSAFVASYAFQSQERNDRSQCKVDRQIKRQIQQEERQCLTDESYFANSPYRYQQGQYQQQSNQGQYQQNQNQQNQYQNKKYQQGQWQNQNQNQNQNQGSADCQQQVSQNAQQVVYDVVNNFLKPSVWSTEKRHRYASTVANKVGQQSEKFLQQGSAENIAKAVASAACTNMGYVPVGSSVAKFACRGAQPLLRKAVRHAVNPICQKSDCCTPSPFSSSEEDEVESQLSYALADSAESTETNIPYIENGSQSKTNCQKMLQKYLQASLPKQAFFNLQQQEEQNEMSSKKITSLTEAFKIRIPKAVQQTLEKEGQLAEQLNDALDEAFGQQYKQQAHKQHQLVRAYTKIAVEELREATNGKCNFHKHNQA